MKNRKPYLFYYEEALDAWIPAPENVNSLMPIENLDGGEEREIRFKRLDLTDKELDELPEEQTNE